MFSINPLLRLATVVVVLLLRPAWVTGSPARPDSSDELFTQRTVRTIKIEIAEPALDALRASPRKYVSATFREGTSVLAKVGVHLKGMGSFRPLDEKPNLAVKFDEFEDGLEYMGLTKLLLNNCTQDPTYIAEFLASQMFRDAGVPAARVTHALVELNGRKLGLYALVEAMNKRFLKRQFTNAKGNLYEGYLQDIDQKLDQDNGDDLSQNDLKRLLEVCRISNPSERWSQLHAVLEVDVYLSHLACEIFTAHTDGYALNRNNYRLYCDPSTKRFTMMPHGLDWGFANSRIVIRPPENSILTAAVLGTPPGHQLFRERLGQLFTNLFQLQKLAAQIDDVIAKLVTTAANPDELKVLEACGEKMKSRIRARHENIAEQLAAPLPQSVRFDAAGIASLSEWHPVTQAGQPVIDLQREKDKPMLRIQSNSECIASWRTRVYLAPGKYRFTGQACASRIIPASIENHSGACLRISGDKCKSHLTGDASWTLLEHDFEVAVENEEKELVCELRARAGTAFFDRASLKLVRLK
jgi:hypothetical protein